MAPVIVVALAVACGGVGDEEQAPDRTTAGDNGLLHSVSLDEIHFDTFDGRSIPLSEISEERILSLVDAIPPLQEPAYDEVATDEWLDDDDLVLGYDGENGRAWAFPFKIMAFHEIVNDRLDGTPVLVTYCPLCQSGIVYDRRLAERELLFGNTSALYNNDLVMFDRETDSYWWQVAGEAIVGPLTGSRLDVLPSITTTWSDWRELHPQTLVLSRDTGFDRPYERDLFAGYRDSVNDQRFPFPVSSNALDGRLAPGDEVLGLTVNGESRAYSLRAIGDGAINDRLGGEPVVILSSASGPSGGAYSSEVDGQLLSFRYEKGSYVDAETETKWSLSGEAVSGPIAGRQLEALPTRYTFWFAYAAAFPDADVYAQ